MNEPQVQEKPVTSYDPGYFNPLFLAEDRHFWFRSRNKVIEKSLSGIIGSLPAGYRMLEIGCGTGNVLRMLERICDHGKVIGMDLFAEGLQFARRRVSCPLIQADLNCPPFRQDFSIIGMFDVLEHLEQDVAVLKTVGQMLCQNGVVILTVPAFQSLFSYFDEASHHFRRYEIDNLHSALSKAGYRVEYISYYMALTFPVVWLVRKLSPLLNGRKQVTSQQENDELVHDMSVDELRIVPVANEILAWLLTREAWFVSHHIRLPFGTSLIAIARKIE
ncbi:MAG: class I SAM-dependent methyltransferase [Anaerolineaceae bacterium]|nr:class I SAM-dependent methyltransferase [Anaerolineaceae bacterium]